MNGLLAFSGQVFLPISQMALWVLGLRDRAETEGTSEPIELEVTAAENQDFLPLGQIFGFVFVPTLSRSEPILGRLWLNFGLTLGQLWADSG